VTKAAEAVGVVIVCLLIAPLVIYLLGRWTGLPQKLAILIGVGTAICGGTAIAIAAPVIRAEEEDVSYSIGTIALFGLAAIFVYPLLGHLLHFSSKVFGLWAGTAIHSTPQVLAAGFIFSEEAGQIATVAKLFRNMFMIPLAFLLALWYARKTAADGQSGSTGVQALRAFPYFLFGFLALVIVRTVGDGLASIPQGPWKAFIDFDKSVAKFLILTAMAGIGLRTELRSMKSIGYKPFVVGLVGSVILALVSIVIINVFVA